jgi:hypothetical protein
MKQKRKEIINLIFGGANFLTQREINELVSIISTYPNKVYLRYEDVAEYLEFFGPEITMDRMKKRKELVLNYDTLVKNIEVKLPEYFI